MWLHSHKIVDRAAFLLEGKPGEWGLNSGAWRLPDARSPTDAVPFLDFDAQPYLGFSTFGALHRHFTALEAPGRRVRCAYDGPSVQAMPGRWADGRQSWDRLTSLSCVGPWTMPRGQVLTVFTVSHKPEGGLPVYAQHGQLVMFTVDEDDKETYWQPVSLGSSQDDVPSLVMSNFTFVK